jgi:tetratricopeptide (TPR) repeat protein
LLLLLWDILATRRRRGASAALVVLLACALGTPARRLAAQAGRLDQDAQRSFLDKRPLPAARAWRRALEAGDRSPQTLFNLGTAYLAADSLDSAIEVLERAATIPLAGLRSNAQFNLGLAYLRRGMATAGQAAAQSYMGAVRAYRSVLLATPNDSAARWNYELAKRKLVSAQSSSGGQGGGGGEGQPQQSPSSGALARDEASQLLDAAARDERDVQAKQQRGEHQVLVRGKDW